MFVNTKEKTKIALQYHQSGKLSDAQSLYEEILKETPYDVSVLNLLGLLKFQTNHFEEAVFYINKAININSCDYFYENLGRVYSAQKNYENSIICYKKALELNPNNFNAWFSLGLDYKKINQPDLAIKSYEQALEIKPNDSSSYFNLANVYESKNETFAAVKCYEKAYKYNLNEQDFDISYFLGVSYLKIKNFKKGLEFYENRPSKSFTVLTQTLQYKEQIETKPEWDGTPMKDKTIFVYYESALGDTLMYLRYLFLVKEMFAKVLFKPQSCFINFFKENDLGVEIIDNKNLPENVIFDTHISLMSLPYALKLYTENMPFNEGYLKANIEKTKDYKIKYFDNEKLKIGIKWKGNTACDLTRVISLEAFYKLFDLPNTQFYSLQKDEGSEELENTPNQYNIINLGQTFNDFTDTAAAVENCDLIICNDTSVAHLAGVMGKQCLILLPFVQNWRWYTDLSYSPWYKSVKLFKQTEPGNWDEVFQKVKEHISCLIKN